MQRRTLDLKLNSPAFLGDASQSGVWRTPPIKALLREWWRIAQAPKAEFKHAILREQEGLLFGNAWLEPLADRKSRYSKSQIRLALKEWRGGRPGWDTTDPSVPHPEVNKARPVGSQRYLGYGPLMFQQGTRLKTNAALQADETNELDLANLEMHETVIDHTLHLIDWFGTFGGRSRNGWGSLSLGLEPLSPTHLHLTSVLRALESCLKLDWPHAIGSDNKGGLIWESKEPFGDWKAAMAFLAKTKIGFRTNLGFTTGKRSPSVEGRHLLAYPVTNHDVAAWGGQARLANQLRFKLFRDAAGQLRTRIYHTPHACPLPAQGLDQLATWQTIHCWLDQQADLQRLGAK